MPNVLHGVTMTTDNILDRLGSIMEALERYKEEPAYNRLSVVDEGLTFLYNMIAEEALNAKRAARIEAEKD